MNVLRKKTEYSTVRENKPDSWIKGPFGPMFFFVVGLFLIFLLNGCGSFLGGDFHSGYYQVRKGDTLASIAWRYDLNYRELARWNDLPYPYTIYPGQLLRMNPPSAGGLRTASPNQVPMPATSPTGESDLRKKPHRLSLDHIASKIHWVWPAKGRLIGQYHSHSNTGINSGINIRGSLGQKVYAAAGGRVVYSGNGLPSYGNLLVIRQNAHLLTAYGDCQKLLVKEGESVRQGQVIAAMGESGKNIHVPTLHFEIRINGNPVDPLKYLPPRSQ